LFFTFKRYRAELAKETCVGSVQGSVTWPSKSHSGRSAPPKKRRNSGQTGVWDAENLHEVAIGHLSSKTVCGGTSIDSFRHESCANSSERYTATGEML
jgi:hypothetical protein